MNKNPYIPTSPKWYEHELNEMFPNETIRPSRGYKYHVGNKIVDCKDNDVSKWSVIK